MAKSNSPQLADNIHLAGELLFSEMLKSTKSPFFPEFLCNVTSQSKSGKMIEVFITLLNKHHDWHVLFAIVRWNSQWL